VLEPLTVADMRALLCYMRRAVCELGSQTALRGGLAIPLEAVYSPERPGKSSLILGARCAVHRLRIVETRFQLDLKSAQHFVSHVPIMQTTSIFALGDIAGIHDKQGLHSWQRHSAALAV
jgi:hypothetical protein